MASDTNQPQEKGITRRSFLRYGLWAGLVVIAAEGAVSTVASLWPKVKAGGVGSVIPAGNAKDYPVGSVTYFPEAHFYISHVDAGFLAMSRKCTHLGCVVPWRADEPSQDSLAPTGRFNCPCHGGIYDRYGRVLAGPPPRPFDLHPITVEGGKLMVDTGKIILREKYDPSQAVKA